MRTRALTWALARLLIVLPLWLLGLVLLLLGLALSPWGTGVLLEQGAKRGFYELGAVEGAPLDRLVLHDLRLEVGAARIALTRFELAWSEECVLQGRLCLDRLAVEGADIRLAEADAGPEAESEEGAGASLEEIRLPFPVELRELSLSDVTLQLADGTRLTWASFTTGVQAEESTLTLLPTRLAGTRLTLPLSAGTRLALSEAEQDGPRLSAAAIDAAIAVRSPLPAGAAAELEGLADLPLDERPRRVLPEVTLPMAVEVPELAIEDVAIDGSVEYGVEQLLLRLSARGQEVEIDTLAVATADADAELMARVALRDDYPLEARLAADLYLPERMPALEGERVELALAGSLADLEVDLVTRGPVEAHLVARLDALDPTLPFTASLQSDALQWPLPGAEEPPVGEGKEAPAEAGDEADEAGEDTSEAPAEPWQVEALAVHLEGSLVDYRSRVSLNVQGPSLPPTDLLVSGSGDLEHFRWSPLTVNQQGAVLLSRGQAAWRDGLDVAATLTLDNLDPGRFVEGLDGRLGGGAELAFVQGDAGWRLEVPGLDIQGVLDDRPLSLEAVLAGDSEMRWDIETLDFRQGANRVSLAGRVTREALDLAGDLDMPTLDTLYPDLGGTLAGRFTTAGSLEAPELDLALTGRSLAFAGNAVEALDLTARVAGLEDPDLALALEVSRLEAGGQRLDALTLDLDGRLSEHRLRLAAEGGDEMPLSRLVLALEGGLDGARERYRGVLSPLEIDSEFGDIRLAEALTFDADLPAGSARVAPFCLTRRQGGEVCLTDPLEASAEAGRAALAIRDLPMDLADAAMPPGWRISGESGGNLEAGWSAGGTRWQLAADLDSRAEVTGEDAYGRPWSVPGTSLGLQVDASETRADLDLLLGLADSGELRLALGIDEPLGEGGLDGRLRIEDLRLAPYRPLAAGLETLEGGLDGDIRIGGTRETPRLDGRLALSGLRAGGLDLPLDVRDGELVVELAGDRADIDGFLAADEGRLEIGGNARWPASGSWQAAVDLQAVDDPLLAVLPEFGRLRLAPDLRIRATPERLQVRGTVDIPWARLEAGEVPDSAMAPSPDEVIITEEQDRRAEEAAAEQRDATQDGETGESTAEAMARAGMATDVLITLSLGPDMQLEAYGLESGLSGNLEVRQQNGPVQLFGDVSLVDGRFRAFGQDLLIREGIIFFSGPPGQPLLDFEAIRNPATTQDGVIAGMRVTGSADSPSLEIFSEPAMDEASALSYLLRGRAPGGSGGADGALTSALIGITLGQTGGAVGAIGEAFGIDDLSLDTAGAGEESQVVVTGNLTERLSIGYGVGVFSPIAELTLRYQLWRSLYLEAVSGAAQAVDLVYSFSLPGDPPSP
ncbi:translocation/assembly module TamB domain-containing protein [Halomonas rhizosphaerae]|uniref:Translocation/assembly module TamB domain-containing protein n=1 Tax=Halomonas rhizosphaerae TaxID=3043296 RepID=A0ABT6V1C6_9GAMM|nr:translocation/assembly module TamB domain-containing protein [Halomonas rhizosphaerae]MDI5892028.1 translocation/assembly module TamB domain-containing protein [Halomonas rhizosphaerae]MDI5920530.1 translocation/assembly module TamB domain-containing protein [Halomonas rhizosphaerae]